MIYMFFLKICWVRKRSLILILSSYLVMIFACFWKALCIWEFGIDNKIVLCVRNGSSCIHVYTTPFLFRIDLLLHVCTSSVFRKFFALFYFLRLEKAGKKKPPSYDGERDVYSNICTLIVFKNRTCCLSVTDPPHFAWGNVGNDQKRKLPTTLFVVPLICFCAYLKHQSF